MADFAANLLSVPSVASTEANGGNAAARLTAIPPSIFGGAFASGQDAIFVASPPLFQGILTSGFSPANVMTLGAELPLRAINRVFDSVANRAVTWVTLGEDPAGDDYPGPGVYGVNTSNYVLVGYVSG